MPQPKKQLLTFGAANLNDWSLGFDLSSGCLRAQISKGDHGTN